MNTIPHLEWVTANARITVGPVGGELPTVAASEQEQDRAVMVHRDLKRLLDRADIQPPPTGKVLTMAHVDEKLTAANISTDDRMVVKEQLVKLRMLSEGRPVNI